MIEISIGGFGVDYASMDALIEARAAIETSILSRAADELALIEKRKQLLEQMLGHSDRVLDAPNVTPIKRRREPVNPPKYYNPENPELTWTGRGKAPGWFDPENPAGFERNDLVPAMQLQPSLIMSTTPGMPTPPSESAAAMAYMLAA